MISGDPRVFEKIKDNQKDKAIFIPTRMGRPLKASIETLSQTTIDKARMVRASKIAYESGFRKAQAYLDSQQIPWDIDVPLSSRASLVLLGEEGEVKIAYRGTKIRDINDVTADAQILTGTEESNPEFISAEEQLRLVTERYGPPSELIGYSLGGAKAITLGSKANIDTTTFNPFLGKTLVSGKGKGRHQLFRTTEDFASIGIGLAPKKSNWKVDSILPHQDRLNPIEAHELENFSEVSARRPGNTEILMRGVQRQGTKTGELELLHSITEAQQGGLSFTEWVHEFNSRTGQDTSSDGSQLRGNRMHRQSKWSKYWEESKNQQGDSRPAFTSAEEAHFDSIGDTTSTYDPHVKPSERVNFRNKPPKVREAIVAEEHAKLRTLMKAVDMHAAPYEAAVNPLKRAAHPTGIVTAMFGGLVAHELMDVVIDPNHKIQETPRVGLEGLMAGVSTEMSAAALAGTALTAAGTGVGAVAGATSYLAAHATYKGVRGGLQKLDENNNYLQDDAKDELSDVAAGAVGGATAAATAIAGAALLGTEIGALGGPMGLALGAGIGSLIGLGGWLIGTMFD